VTDRGTLVLQPQALHEKRTKMLCSCPSVAWESGCYTDVRLLLHCIVCHGQVVGVRHVYMMYALRTIRATLAIYNCFRERWCNESPAPYSVLVEHKEIKR
jgi:hypothetical protein